MKIFLDTCAIIYWVEMADPFYSKFVELVNRIKKKYKECSFAVSYLSLLECRVQPMREKNEILLKQYQQFFCAGDLSLVPLSLEVIEKATELRVFYSIRTPDALQAASALSINEEVIFLTNDKSFKKILKLNCLILS